MTDEEMAEKYADWYWGASLSAKRALKEAYLAGLKAGRPKWHKASKEEHKELLDLPNWDNEIFKEITGIDAEFEIKKESE